MFPWEHTWTLFPPMHELLVRLVVESDWLGQLKEVSVCNSVWVYRKVAHLFENNSLLVGSIGTLGIAFGTICASVGHTLALLDLHRSVYETTTVLHTYHLVWCVYERERATIEIDERERERKREREREREREVGVYIWLDAMSLIKLYHYLPFQNPLRGGER